MAEFETFLASLYSSKPRFRFAKAVIKHRFNLDFAPIPQDAVKAEYETHSNVDPRVVEETLSVFLEPPIFARIDYYGSKMHTNNIENSVIMNSDGIFRYDHESKIYDSLPGNGVFADSDRHFAPDMILGFFQYLALVPTGLSQIVGRTCVRLRATPRPGVVIWPHWLPFGAEEYEFYAEPERAVLLAIIARYGGRVFDTRRIISLDYDGLIDRSLFRQNG